MARRVLFPSEPSELSIALPSRSQEPKPHLPPSAPSPSSLYPSSLFSDRRFFCPESPSSTRYLSSLTSIGAEFEATFVTDQRRPPPPTTSSSSPSPETIEALVSNPADPSFLLDDPSCVLHRLPPSPTLPPHPPIEAKKHLLDMVVSTLVAKIDRPMGIFCFLIAKDSNDILNSWAMNLVKLLDLAGKSYHKIHKESIVHKAVLKGVT